MNLSGNLEAVNPAGPAEEAAAAAATPDPDPTSSKLSVICDKCKKEAGPLKVAQRKLRKGFIEIGMACPHCGFWGHSYYTNPDLEKAIKVLGNFKAHARRSPKDREKYEKKRVEFRRRYQKVQERAKRLVLAT